MDRDKLVSEDQVRFGPALIEAGRVLWRYAGALLAVGLALVLPLELLGAALTRGNPDVPRSGAPVGTDVVSGLIKVEPILGDVLVLLLGVPVVAGAVVLLVAAVQVERPVSLSTAFAAARKRAGRLILVSVTLAAGIAVASLVSALLGAAIPEVLPAAPVSDVVAAVVLLIGFAALLPYAVVAFPSAMLQRSSAGAAIRSAFVVARDEFVMLLGRGLVVFVLASALGTIARAVVMLVVGLIGTGPFADAIGEAVADAVFIPAFAAGATLMYLDVRGRRGEIDRRRLDREVAAART